MTDILRKLSDLLGPSGRKHAYPVFALVLLMAAFETVGVASIMPFIALLANPDIVEENRYLAEVYRILAFDSRESFIVFLGLVSLGLLIGSVILRGLTLWTQMRFVSLQTHVVATRMVSSYLRQPFEWFLHQRSADLGANVLHEVTNVFQGVASSLMLLVANGIVVFFLTALLVIVDPLLAAIAISALGGVYLIVFLASQKYVAKLGGVRVDMNRERHRALYDAFGGIKDIKVTGTEEYFLDRFRTSSERMAHTTIRHALISELPSFFMQAVVFGGMLLVILYLMVVHGSLQQALPIISLYALAGYRLLPSLQSAYKSLAAIRFGLPALESLHRDVRQFDRGWPEIQSGIEQTSAGSTICLHSVLELRHVTFRYQGADSPALLDMSLSIRARTVVALVGATGSGKSTAADIILGLLDPSSGRVHVDGAEIGHDNVRAWQRRVGYVPQSIFLCDDTVAANIAFGVPAHHVDRAAIERAGRIASIHDFVTTELAEGYDTTIGERGVRLSGGQRQRLGIARALYHDPDVLIFDEATSALDSVTEQAVMDAVYRVGKNKTVVMIAHRLSTVRDCDKIFVLEHGQIVDSGRFAELLARCAAFREMVSHAAETSSKSAFDKPEASA